jgi:hypothetical protein
MKRKKEKKKMKMNYLDLKRGGSGKIKNINICK